MIYYSLKSGPHTVSGTTVLGRFAFSGSRGVSHDCGKQKIRNGKPERRRTFSHALLRVATPHLLPEFHPVETSSDAAPPARVSTG
ncbi:hypothetical protein [Sutterella sp. KLE1602]|uniref:hypothetical protein n=1 Tax=Sutterella sp. KLE1602 TaxID=1574262 RepID=UPI0012E77D65|nr:hypothetical protein [Sutterella sp. KLE1602]